MQLKNNESLNIKKHQKQRLQQHSFVEEAEYLKTGLETNNQS